MPNISRHDYYAAHAPDTIPDWFKDNFEGEPELEEKASYFWERQAVKLRNEVNLYIAWRHHYADLMTRGIEQDYEKGYRVKDAPEKTIYDWSTAPEEATLAITNDDGMTLWGTFIDAVANFKGGWTGEKRNPGDACCWLKHLAGPVVLNPPTDWRQSKEFRPK
jgi:hypothetical protein